jgi:hypothetical protein
VQTNGKDVGFIDFFVCFSLYFFQGNSSPSR